MAPTPSNFTLGTMQEDRQTHTCPSDCQTEKHDLSPLLYSPVLTCFTPLCSSLCIVLHDLRIVCSCLAMEKHRFPWKAVYTRFSS